MTQTWVSYDTDLGKLLHSNESHLAIVEWVGPLLQDNNTKMASAKVHDSAYHAKLHLSDVPGPKYTL